MIITEFYPSAPIHVIYTAFEIWNVLCNECAPSVLEEKTGETVKENQPPGWQCLSTYMLPSVDWKIMIYPPYSPDLPSCDFCMFGPTKVHLGGQKFQTDNDLKRGAVNWLCIED